MPPLKEGVKSCGGRSMIPAPGFIRNAIFWSIEECERLLGHPGNTPSITVVFQQNYTKLLNQAVIAALLQNFYREDQIFCDDF